MDRRAHARLRGRAWGYEAARRRTGPPASWPAFDGTVENARKRVLDLAERPSPLQVTLTQDCLAAAAATFNEVRDTLVAAAVPVPVEVGPTREERRRWRERRG